MGSLDITTRHLFIAAAAIALAAGQARADALQNQILAAARTTPREGYAFRRTIVSEQTGGPRRTYVEQYDPRRPAAARWSLLSIDGHAPTPKEATGWRKVHDGPTPSYAELAKWFGAAATRTDSASGYVTYRFARLPAGMLKIGSHDASADTQAEAIVNTRGKLPFVERVRLSSTTPFRMMLVASVQSLVFTNSYSLLPDGHAVPAQSGSILSGSMMGKSGEIKSAVTFTDFQAVQ